jgi:hypothetical protein
LHFGHDFQFAFEPVGGDLIWIESPVSPAARHDSPRSTIKLEGCPHAVTEFACSAKASSPYSSKEHKLTSKSFVGIPQVFHGGLWPAIGGHSDLTIILQKQKTLLFLEAGFFENFS